MREYLSKIRSSRSIRHYFLSSIGTVLLLSVLVTGIIQIVIAMVFFRNEKKEMLERFAVKVSSELEDGFLTLENIMVYGIDFMADITESQLAIANSNGYIVFHSRSSPMVTGQQLPQRVRQTIDETGSISEISDMDGMLETKHFIFGQRMTDPSANNTYYVITGSETGSFYRYIVDIVAVFLGSAIIVFGLSIFLAVFLTSKITKPLESLGEAAKAFGEGNYSVRVGVQGDDEITQLSILLNEMASSFEASEQSHRRFMGDLAHELRTPMTSIKGFVDAILDGAIPEDKREHYLKIVSQEVGRMSRLTQNMLDVSKIESGDYNIELKEFNIWEIIAAVVDTDENSLNSKNINVVFRGENEVAKVLADRDMVYQIVYNLVDNAIKFSSENGEISILVQRGKSFSTISIKNYGQGISPEEVQRVFERMYKSDKSRSMNKSGSGLGLHICKVLTQLLGGRIWAESDGETFTEMHFTLPNGGRGIFQSKDKIGLQQNISL